MQKLAQILQILLSVILVLASDSIKIHTYGMVSHK